MGRPRRRGGPDSALNRERRSWPFVRTFMDNRGSDGDEKRDRVVGNQRNPTARGGMLVPGLRTWGNIHVSSHRSITVRPDLRLTYGHPSTVAVVPILLRFLATAAQEATAAVPAVPAGHVTIAATKARQEGFRCIVPGGVTVLRLCAVGPR